jgi:hypothetical protein
VLAFAAAACFALALLLDLFDVRGGDAFSAMTLLFAGLLLLALHLAGIGRRRSGSGNRLDL